MTKLRKGDLLVTKRGRDCETEKVWGSGVVLEHKELTYPTAYLVFWFKHGRSMVLEEEVLLEEFEVVRDEKERKST